MKNKTEIWELKETLMSNCILILVILDVPGLQVGWAHMCYHFNWDLSEELVDNVTNSEGIYIAQVLVLEV